MQAAPNRKTSPQIHPEKASARKTYRERQQAREKMDEAVHALYTECVFRPCDFFDFQQGNVSQAGTLVLSRTDPDGRYLVLQTWPDVAGDPSKSTWQAICPPGREHHAQAVCRAVQAFNGNAAGRQMREEAAAKPKEDRSLLEDAVLEDAIISASVREIEQSRIEQRVRDEREETAPNAGLGEAVK